jgi:transcriptional regulator with PAS, ATPase and Fis domain
LRMPDLSAARQLQSSYAALTYPADGGQHTQEGFYQPLDHDRVTPIIIESGKAAHGYDKSEVEDAPLAMDEIEKEAIKRALTKYKGRRKEAAEELKISERTLYRKIKQYDL